MGELSVTAPIRKWAVAANSAEPETESGRRGRRPREVWPSARRPWAAAWRERRRVARESLAFIVHGWATTTLVWMLIGIALALPAALYIAQTNLARAAGEWGGTPGFSVYFVPGIDAGGPTALAERLRAEPGVFNVRLISPHEALSELSDHGGWTDALEVLSTSEGNPLPTTIRASVAWAAGPDRLATLAEEASGVDGVDEVVAEKTWLERLTAIREVTRRIAVFVGVLLGLSAVLISAASVRLAIAARLAEQEVLAVVGADGPFIRRPFLYLGVLYGLGGAMVSAVLLSAALVVLEGPLGRLFASYGADLQLAGFDPMFLMVLLASGAVLGALGARVAVHRPREPRE